LGIELGAFGGEIVETDMFPIRNTGDGEGFLSGNVRATESEKTRPGRVLMANAFDWQLREMPAEQRSLIRAGQGHSRAMWARQKSKRKKSPLLATLCPSEPIPDHQSRIVGGFQRTAHLLDANFSQIDVAFAGYVEGVDIQRPASDR
jgi:hypothetical protein